MKFLVFALFVAATAVSALRISTVETPLQQAPRRSPRIVGGEEATPHSIPYQVAVMLAGNRLCGGTLITRRYVLTAGHCGAADKAPNILMGVHKIKENESSRVSMTAKKVNVHENFNGASLKNDLALIELPQEAPSNQYIGVVKLATPEVGLLVGNLVEASGWGITADGSKEMSPVLRRVETEVIKNEDCAKRFIGIDINDHILCIDGSKKKSTCMGDSGGPLVMRTNSTFTNERILVGISSFVAGAGCEKGFPAGFSRISAFIDWIKKHSDYN